MGEGRIARQWAIDYFSVEVIGKKFEEFIDNTECTNYKFEDKEDKSTIKKNNPNAYIPRIENDSEWVLTLYRDILATENHVNDDGYKTWMESLSNKVPREQIEDYFRKVARDHNAKYFPEKKAAYLKKYDEGKGRVYVMPESSVDVFISTSLLKSVKEKYPDYNLYFATKPEYFHILQGNPYIYKTIPYNEQFDSTLYLEGVGDNKGFFEIAFTPHITTQRVNNYIHNCKDLIDKKRLCTF